MDEASEPHVAGKLPSRYLAIPIALSIVIVVIVLLLLYLAMIPEERCQYHRQIELEMIGLIDRWYNFSVVDTCLFDGDSSEVFSLEKVFLHIGESGSTIQFLDNETMVSQITLEKARENGMNPFYWGTVKYIDTDGDNCVSKGDFLLIMSADYGGPLEDGRFIEIDSLEAIYLVYFCCE